MERREFDVYKWMVTGIRPSFQNYLALIEEKNCKDCPLRKLCPLYLSEYNPQIHEIQKQIEERTNKYVHFVCPVILNNKLRR